MAYCTSNDLFIDHQMYTDITEKDRYVQFAADSMDSKLGYIYVVPIATTGIPAHQSTLLKTINAQLATGRLIMSRSSAHQESQVHAYALYLIRQAEMDLMAIANGNVDLTAPRVNGEGDILGTLDDPATADALARTPSGWNPDATSPVTAFEKNIMSGSTESAYWVPGDNIEGLGETGSPR